MQMLLRRPKALRYLVNLAQVLCFNLLQNCPILLKMYTYEVVFGSIIIYIISDEIISLKIRCYKVCHQTNELSMKFYIYI